MFQRCPYDVPTIFQRCPSDVLCFSPYANAAVGRVFALTPKLCRMIVVAEVYEVCHMLKTISQQHKQNTGGHSSSHRASQKLSRSSVDSKFPPIISARHNTTLRYYNIRHIRQLCANQCNTMQIDGTPLECHWKLIGNIVGTSFEIRWKIV